MPYAVVFLEAGGLISVADCCNDKACGIEALKARQGSTLKAVLAINVLMFFIEAVAGVLSRSMALQADSLDMLGDSLVYGISLYVIGRGVRWQARVALFKGLIMAGFGLFILGEALYKVFYPAMPVAAAIGSVGALALLANSACLVLLWRHRGDDINMNSVWLCSRNDIIANVSVLAAGVAVWMTESAWPDIIIGIGIAIVFMRSAFFVISRSTRNLISQAALK